MNEYGQTIDEQSSLTGLCLEKFKHNWKICRLNARIFLDRNINQGKAILVYISLYKTPTSFCRYYRLNCTLSLVNI